MVNVQIGANSGGGKLDSQRASPGISRSSDHIGAKDQGIVRVIVTADNHLSAYAPKLPPARLEERRKRLGMAFKQTVDTALDRRAHLFIQAGDLFDGVEPRNKERDFVAKQLMRLQLAGIRTFGVSGNHDTPRQKIEQGGFAPQSIYHQLGGMHYFDSSDVILPVQVDVAELQLALAGLSYHPGVAPGADPLDHVKLVDPDGICAMADVGVLILHAAIEGHAFPGEAETFVRRSSLATFENFNVVLAGHVHAYDRFSIGEQAVVVCGATERMEFGQAEDQPGFVYLEITRDGLRHAEHISIKPQPRHVITIRTTELWPPHHANDGTDQETSPATESAAVIQALTERILHKLEPYCSDEAMIRLILEGPITREQYHMLDVRGIWMYGQQRAFSFELDESRLFLTIDLFQASIERGERIAPRGMLSAVVKEWMERAETPKARAILTKTRQRVLDRYEELSGSEAM